MYRSHTFDHDSILQRWALKIESRIYQPIFCAKVLELFSEVGYMVLTAELRQKGSAESKSLEGKEEVGREPITGPDAPIASSPESKLVDAPHLETGK